MGATNRSSTLYTNYETNKYIPVPGDRGGIVYPIRFTATVVSASAANDTYDLFVIPAGWTVCFLFATTNGLGASAGAGATAQIGDAGSATRLMVATDFDASGAQGFLAYAGVGYSPTTDTIEELLIGTAAGVVGQVFTGYVFLIHP